MDQNENLLFRHIQEYRRKYYLNQIIRGSLILLIIISSVLFVTIMGEGLLGFNAGARTGLVGGISLLFIGVLGYYVLWPAGKLLNLSRGLSDSDVARLVRRHFPDVDDKLINLLELKESGGDHVSQELLMAAISKKTEELAPVPFAKAINFNVNLRYARYLAAPLGLFLIIGILNPDLIRRGSEHLLNFNQEFLPEAPFRIDIENHKDKVIEGENFEMDAAVNGRELPAELYVYIKKVSDNSYVNYPMEKFRNDQFGYQFSDIKEEFSYYVGNEEVKSDLKTVEVWSRPAIRSFRVVIDYPDYTGLVTDTLADNIGDFKALRGSKVSWLLDPVGDVSEAKFIGVETALFLTDDKTGLFRFDKAVSVDEEYFLNLKSARGIMNIDTVKYRIDALEDRYPSIYVNNPQSNFQADFNMNMPLDFEVSDDYGFSRLSLLYRYKEASDPGKVSPEYKEVPLNVSPRELFQHKALEVDLLNLDMEEGDVLEYVVKVWDNDYVTGPKFSVSSVFTVNYPSLDEKYEQVDENQEEILDELAKVREELRQIQEEMEEISEKTLNQRKLDYDDKKQMQQLIDRHERAREQIEELQQKMKENSEFMENNEMISEQTLEKYEKLNELFEKIDDPRLNEMMEKLQEQMEKIDPNELRDMMEEMKLDEEEMENNIDRTMELLNQLQVQEKIEEIRTKLEDLQNKQENLQEKLNETSEKDQEKMDEIAEQQEKLAEKMEQLEKDLEDLEDMKSGTETPDKEQMDELQEDAEDTEQDMQEGADQMKEGDKKSGQQSQQGAQQKMQKMQEKLSSMQMQSQSQQDQANLESLRELLENLLRLSFKQEDLRDDMQQINASDPQLFVKEAEQKQLLDDMMMVKDSLDALARKVFQIEKFVTDESKEIIRSMRGAQQAMDDKQMRNITHHQHQSMTSINNLANMLTDVMQQMQMQMKSQKPGSGQCTKPGSGTPSLQQLGKMQGDLNQMMQQMMQGGKGMSPSDMAKMAAEQEKIRKQLKEAHERIRQQGGKALGDMQSIMDMMQETEDDLRNKELSHETLMRQRQILNRLLDSFKAVREKNEFEERRESETGKDYDQSPPDELDIEEYRNRIRQELLKSNQLEYSNDFIILIEKYFKLLENTDER